MRGTNTKRVLLTALSIMASAVVLSAPVVAGQAATMGTSEGYDLDALLENARSSFALQANDAVILIEARKVSLSGLGGAVTRVHQVVWIGTEKGIDDYADQRIAWDSARSRFEVIKLRTWSGGRWWPDESKVSETAVVETLPFAVALADDYTSMRETMLLHDGVELPCVMETVYEISEDSAPAAGRDGIFVMQLGDPAVRVEFTLETAGGIEAGFRTGGGVPGPAAGSVGAADGARTWTLEDMGPLGRPVLDDASAYAPYVEWSTWRGWDSLAEAVMSMFGGAGVSGTARDDIEDAMAGIKEGTLTDAEKAAAVARVVDENVRNINYPSRPWMSAARPVARTWETAYGTALDRAVLAGLLFSIAGLESEPVYLSVLPGSAAPGIPALSSFGETALLVTAPGLKAIYDPSTGTMEHFAAAAAGRLLWRPALGGKGPVRVEASGSFDLELDLAIDSGGAVTGSGLLKADGVYSPAIAIAVEEGGIAEYLSGFAESLIPGMKADEISPESVGMEEVAVRFDLSGGSVVKDGDRWRLVIGDPQGGLIDRLPGDVHLYEAGRGAPVLFGFAPKQRISVTVETGGRKAVYVPESARTENGAGSFSLDASEDGGRISMTRSIQLSSGSLPAELWQELRKLLLEESDEANATVILE